ncbi:hypothetical protein FRUB_04052 [Fimbriiglobus ruber]|uniref:Uncharacterized protein n=1 Tax=Fimbriiglobus ruber TaxID=1908690 RepID=A0A225DQS8_9BACT|nr:hypothetical protein FRUB_04052 [Fimbriiglobus ruber]
MWRFSLHLDIHSLSLPINVHVNPRGFHVDIGLVLLGGRWGWGWLAADEQKYREKQEATH